MSESRAVLSLAAILSFRMLGLFMIYPVFAIYAPQFHYANNNLIGIALGIYGLTQAALQLPLSMLSDHIGRKKVIVAGLYVFAAGSILCAITQNIYGLILGRAFQGAGAIGSTLMAFCTDLTSPRNRTKAMAILGATIGLSFGLAIVFGPIVNSFFHLSGIFWLTAMLAMLGILIIRYALPDITQHTNQGPQLAPLQIIKTLFLQQDLLKFNLSVLFLHCLLTSIFSVIPLFFLKIGVSSVHQWQFYLPILLTAFLLTLTMLNFAEKRSLIKGPLLTAIAMLAVSQFIFCYYLPTKSSVIIALFIFFSGFTLLEAVLPSMVSKIAPKQHKGSAMGLYSSFQFMGIFIGGAVSGIARSHYPDTLIFYINILLCCFWFLFMSYQIFPKRLIFNQSTDSQPS